MLDLLLTIARVLSGARFLRSGSPARAHAMLPSLGKGPASGRRRRAGEGEKVEGSGSKVREAVKSVASETIGA